MYSESEKFAILSEVAYDNKKLDEYFGGGEYQLDPELTTKNSTVIIGSDGIIISYRGTNIHDASDIIADIGIATGLNHLPMPLRPSRFKEADKVYLDTAAKYPGAQITTTGHSLGAAQSLQVAKEHGLTGHHFAVGSSLVDAGLQLKNFVACSGSEASCPELKQQTIYATGSDVLSAGILPHLTKMFGKEHVKLVKPRLDIRDFFHHSLAHFLPDAKTIATETKKPVDEVYKKIEAADPIKFAIMSQRDEDFCTLFPNHPTCLKTKIKARP